MSERTDQRKNRESRETAGRPGFVLFLAVAFVVVCLLILVQYVRHERRTLSRQGLEQLATIRQLAGEHLATDRHFLELLADKVGTGELTPDEFQKRAAQYVTYNPQLINIVWADAGFVIRHTAPLEPNREVIGLPLELPEPKRASRLARSSGQAAYTSPFVVLQGVHAFEVYFPIFRGGTFLGTFSGIYSIERFADLLAATLPQQNVALALHHIGDSRPPSGPAASSIVQIQVSSPLDEIPRLQLGLTLRTFGQPGEVIVPLLLAIALASGLLLASLGLSRELKRRRRVEADLRRSEQFYHSVFEHAGLGVTLVNLQGDILQTNRAFADMLEYDPEELKGINFKDFTHPDDIESSVNHLNPLKEGKVAAYQLEKRYRTRSGKTVWTELTATCVRSDDGRPEYIIGMSNDITARHLAIDALAASEAQYRNLFDNMAQGVFYQEADGRITTANPAACEMFGLSEDQILGRTSLDPRWKVIREDGRDFPGPEHPSMVALTTGKEVRGVVAGVYNPRTDSIRWLGINAIPEFRPKEDRPFRVFVTLHDFTELKQALEKLAASETNYRLLSEQFQTLLDAIPDPMYMIDRDYNLHWSNLAATRLFGNSPGNGKTCSARFLGRLAVCDSCPVADCFTSGESVTVQTRTEDGKSLTLRTFPVMNEGDQVVRVLVEITDDTEKRRRQQTMLRTGQLAAVGELAAGIAHEINNPINGIINYAQILSNRLAGMSMEQECAERIGREGERIAAIASSLLSYTRDKADQKHPLSLSELLHEIMLMSGTKLRNLGINVNLEVPEDLPPLIASSQHLQQVFLNLLNNARYALQQGVKAGDNRPKVITIRAEEVDRGRIRVTVRDNGCGIPPELLEKVKEPFFTTKPESEGTGLGLAICQEIVENHQGRLDIHSVAGEFTAIILEFPTAG